MKKNRTVIRFGRDLPELLDLDGIVTEKMEATGFGSLSLTISGRQTERIKQVFVEYFAKHFGIGPPRLFGAKFAENYETAYYEALLHSPEKRRAFEFVRAWYHHAAIAQEAGRSMTSRGFLTLLAPLFDAFEKRDTNFFKGLVEAVRIVEQREKSNNIKYQGSLDKWLLEYAAINGPMATHTARELNEQFVSKFHTTSDDKLRRRCNRLGVELKPDARGQGAVRYGKVTGKKANTTPLRRKKD
jgi:hypothetical protein